MHKTPEVQKLNQKGVYYALEKRESVLSVIYTTSIKFS